MLIFKYHLSNQSILRKSCWKGFLHFLETLKRSSIKKSESKRYKTHQHKIPNLYLWAYVFCEALLPITFSLAKRIVRYIATTRIIKSDRRKKTSRFLKLLFNSKHHRSSQMPLKSSINLYPRCSY